MNIGVGCYFLLQGIFLTQGLNSFLLHSRQFFTAKPPGKPHDTDYFKFTILDSKKDTDVYNGLLDSEGEGEGGMIWENGILTCILSCELNRQSMSDAGYSMLGAGAR